MPTYFITRSNFDKLIKTIVLNDEQLKKPCYKKDIFFLSDFEKKEILTLKEFLEEVEKSIGKFNRIEPQKDTFEYVYEAEERFAKYHSNLNCERLHADFKDFEIPTEIKFDKNGKKDIERIKAFRVWFIPFWVIESYFINDYQSII